MRRPTFLEAFASETDSRVPVIAEIKCRTGHGEDLLAGRDPAEIAESYLRHGAAALSVVTGAWFGGTPDLLAEILRREIPLPVLRKDFLCSRKALEETRDLGASAALVTCRFLSRARLEGLVNHALLLGLTPFVEVASAEEIDMVPEGLPIVLAINNADIGSRERNGPGLSRSRELHRLARKRRPALVVSASRMLAPSMAVEMLREGFDAVLMGTALMRSPEMLEEIRRQVRNAPADA